MKYKITFKTKRKPLIVDKLSDVLAIRYIEKKYPKDEINSIERLI